MKAIDLITLLRNAMEIAENDNIDVRFMDSYNPNSKHDFEIDERAVKDLNKWIDKDKTYVLFPVMNIVE
jgi:hypothetical protein